MKDSTKKALKLFFKLIGLIVFTIIVYNIGIDKLVKALSQISIFPFIITVVLLICANILKAIRWKVICRGYGYKVPYFFAIRTYMTGTFLGFLTPGRVGDFGRSYYLAKINVPLKKGLVTVIIDRFYDMAFLLFFFVISIIYLQYKYNLIHFDFNKSIYLFKYILIVPILFFIFYFTKPRIFARYRTNILLKTKEFYFDYLRILFNAKQHFVVVAVTVISLFLGYGLFYYLSFRLEIPIGPIDILACAFVISFLQLIPITILGIGTRDITLIYFFQLNNIDPEWAIALSLVVLLANIVAVTPGMVFFVADKYK